MPKFEFRFDLAAILLASVLTALGMSAAHASVNHDASDDARGRSEITASPMVAGGKGGASGGDRSRSGPGGA